MSESTGEFETGAIVYLIVGSPPLVVSGQKRNDGLVCVEWFEGANIHRDCFDPGYLFQETPEMRCQRHRRAGRIMVGSDGIMAEFDEYGGMDYEQASREAHRLVERDGWFQSWSRLAHLRRIMLRDQARKDAT